MARPARQGPRAAEWAGDPSTDLAARPVERTAPRRLGAASGVGRDRARPLAEIRPLLVALADLLVVPASGLIVEPVEASGEEFAALLLSGPLLLLALLASGGYRVPVLDSPRQAALALLAMLAVVTLSVTFLRLADEPPALVLEQGSEWLATAFLALFVVRLALRRLAAAVRGTARRGLPLLAAGETAGAEPARSRVGEALLLVPERVSATPAGLRDLALRLDREAAEEIVVSSRLLERFGEDPLLGARFLDLLLASPGRVRVLLAGGSREPVVFATLVEPALSLGARFAKRALDLFGAGLLLTATAPLLLLVALAVKLDSPGRVFFRQPRLGFGGRLFRIWKFRTMYEEANDLGGRRLTLRNDPRVTRVGAFLRRTSLDELPQLLNVLTGEMSLVGPRPHPVEALAGGRPYAEVVPDIARRLRVKPGMTGLAQVEGWRGNTDTEHKLVARVGADLRYIENWSFWLDLEILLRTPLASLLAKDAY